MNMPAEVRIVEVGPRDGLQNEKSEISTANKIALIDRLSATGLRSIEATAFVSPKWVPQMADASQVLAGITRREGIRYPVLVPNEQGYERARAAGAEEVAVFTAASEAFNLKNTNAGIDESLRRFEPVLARAKADGVRVRGYVSTVLGCDCPRMIEEKQQMLHAHHIALWDAIASCEITGSSDSSIREAVPTDLTPILKTAPIRQIFCNGATSYQLYCRHQQKLTGREAVKLPSTSPANAAWSIERLTQAWSVILDALD